MSKDQLDAFESLLPGASGALDADALLRELRRWAEAGWLRRLDAAFAAFIAETSPGEPPELLFAAAWLAHLEGQGHTCLPLSGLTPLDESVLSGWSPAGLLALRQVASRFSAARADWLILLRASPAVYTADGTRPDALQALVLEQDRLYLRRHWRSERRVAGEVAARVARRFPTDPQQVRLWLDRLFGAADAGGQEIDWQKLACGLALRSGLSLVTGGPGTGKTYTVARLLALLLATRRDASQPARIALAAPTGKAAARLKQSIDAALEALAPQLGEGVPLRDFTQGMGPARTLHSLLGARPDTRRFRHGPNNPLPVDVLIVDEASMVHLEMMAALLQALRPETRLVLLGDKDQLASVEAGAVLGELCRHAEAGCYDETTQAYARAVSGEELPARFLMSGGPALAQQTVMLRTSRRFSGPIGQLAQAVRQGDGAAAIDCLRAGTGGELHWLGEAGLSPADLVRLALDGRPGAPAAYGSYWEAIAQRPESEDPASHGRWAAAVLAAFERFRLLCAVREGAWGVAGLNAALETALAQRQRLRMNEGGWYEGRPVMVMRNDPDAGVFNGDIGMTLRAPEIGAPLKVYFPDGAGVRGLGIGRLGELETAFAMTVHKSQGSEFEHTALVLQNETPSLLTRELVYTGITRARKAFTLALAHPQVLLDALGRSTRRFSGLSEALQQAAANSGEG